MGVSTMKKQKNRGFTLIELLVVIAMVGVLLAFLMPALFAARSNANSGSCANNLRQIGIALHMFADEHENRVPDTPDLLNYLDNREVFVCPEDRRLNEEFDPECPTSYSTNELTPEFLLPSAIERALNETPAYIESNELAKNPAERANIVVTAEINDFAFRHIKDSHCNILYLDGSVSAFKRGETLPAAGGGQVDPEDVPAD